MVKQGLLSATLLLLVALNPLSGSASESAPAYIAVSGKASLTVNPNRAELTLSVEKDANEAAEAQKQVQRVVEKTLMFLSQQGIQTEDIRSTTLSIQPRYIWDKDQQQQRLQGYRASQSIAVTLKDIRLLQTIIDGGLNAGITRLSPPRLFHSEHHELERKVLAMAVKDAQSNAEAAASALSVNVGWPLAIEAQNSDSGATPRPEFRAVAMMAVDGAESVDTQLSGQIEIAVRVNARFTLVR
jgi:uncharacterized protein YggE